MGLLALTCQNQRFREVAAVDSGKVAPQATFTVESSLTADVLTKKLKGNLWKQVHS